MKVRPGVAIAGAVVLGIVMVAAIVLLANRGNQLSENAKTIIIANMIVAIPSLIAAILAFAKADKVEEKADQMHHELKNGLIPAKVKEAVIEMAEDPSQPAITIASDDNS